MIQKVSVVITTISGDENPNLLRITNQCREHANPLFIIGDTSSPSGFKLPGTEYYSIAQQKELDYRLSSSLPVNHYTRKNIGYLLAAASGSDMIIDLDDDNIPDAGFWELQSDESTVSVSGSGWYNIFDYFYGENTWPRGYPLDEILTPENGEVRESTLSERDSIAVEQGMVSGEPDVDAIFRLTRKDRPEPKDRPGVILGPGMWSPFNSQNTRWHKAAFPLMYLPATCAFRMTDIWRSFVAQRGLWLIGKTVLHHRATVTQIRNEHDFMEDFLSELGGYQYNKRITRHLDKVAGNSTDLFDYLHRAYKALVSDSLVEKSELDLIEDWIADIQQAVDFL